VAASAEGLRGQPAAASGVLKQNLKEAPMSFGKRHDKHEKDPIAHGSSGATADMAADPKGSAKEHRRADQAPARPIQPDPPGKKHDQMADRDAENRQEALLDEALEESFPGSDPISPKRIT
jgi:hypothetical protein